jgi:hypothetical protein
MKPLLLVVCLLGLVLPPLSHAETILSRSVVASGGCPIQSSIHGIGGTLGQAFIGVISGAQHRNEIGFWYGLPTAASDVEGETGPLPTRFQLALAGSNPCRDRAILRCAIPQRSEVSIRLYDVSGRLVRTLAEGIQKPGVREVAVDALGLPSGVYYVRMVAEHFAETRRLLLLR